MKWLRIILHSGVENLCFGNQTVSYAWKTKYCISTLWAGNAAELFHQLVNPCTSWIHADIIRVYRHSQMNTVVTFVNVQHKLNFAEGGIECVWPAPCVCTKESTWNPNICALKLYWPQHYCPTVFLCHLHLVGLSFLPGKPLSAFRKVIISIDFFFTYCKIV